MVHTSDKPKILIIGDAVAPTGFARVIRSIFELLHKDYELHQLATRYHKPAFEIDFKPSLTSANSDRIPTVFGF